LNVKGLVTPTVPLEQAAKAYRTIGEHPERSIKLGVSYGS
jgi:threonine dehydrogenase-like Zn-dependent dehydrogenase